MSDDRLQDARRAWEADPSVEAEATYLRERVRNGELSHGDLRVLAELDYPAAKACFARETCPRVASHEDSEADWLRALHAWPDRALARLLVASMRARHTEQLSEKVKVAVAGLEAWVRCPCPEHAEASYLKPEALLLRRNARVMLPWLLPWADALDPAFLDQAWREIRDEVVAGLLGHEPTPLVARAESDSDAR